jgi:Transposase DDE domain
VGYDAGKRVKGRKIHALVDTEGLPLRVVVHSAGMQDRDTRQVKAAVAKLPILRMEVVPPRRPKDLQGPAAAMGRRADLLLDRQQPTARQRLREPCNHLARAMVLP